MRYLMTFSYDGSKYNGYQKQPNENTIQGVLENKLTQINSNNFVSVTASGRTDSGVHAINQKAHFDLYIDMDEEKIRDSLNKMLPPDIYVKQIEKVSEGFHARFNSKKKKYTYKINIGEYNPLEINYVYQFNKSLDVEKMKEAITYFLGEYDFTSYTKKSDEKESCVRTIYEGYINKENNMIFVTFVGNGFLRYMVRNIVGSLIEVGIGKIEPQHIKKIIDSKDRTSAGITAPSCGLYLMDVIYER